jgi:hypothetical protein
MSATMGFTSFDDALAGDRMVLEIDFLVECEFRNHADIRLVVKSEIVRVVVDCG